MKIKFLNNKLDYFELFKENKIKKLKLNNSS